MTGECGTRTAWILAALVIGTVVLTIAYAVTRVAPEPATLVPKVTAPDHRTPSAAATAQALPLGRISDTVTAFVAAWSAADPDGRALALADTATTGLVEQLALTDPSEIPDSCAVIDAPVVVDRTPSAVLVTVATTCEPTLWLGLDQDAQAPHGWRVNAVGRERSWIS